MLGTWRMYIVAGVLILSVGILVAAPPRSQKALWLEVKESGEHKTTIAVTEGIARLFLESKDFKINASEKGKDELITRQMLLSVLNGDEETIEARDSKGEAKIFTKKLSVPSKEGSGSKLVFETYESGNLKLRLAIPDIELEYNAEEGKSHNYVNLMVGWKALLPFLAKEGGAVYIHDHQKHSEVWIYSE